MCLTCTSHTGDVSTWPPCQSSSLSPWRWTSAWPPAWWCRGSGTRRSGTQKVKILPWLVKYFSLIFLSFPFVWVLLRKNLISNIFFSCVRAPFFSLFSLCFSGEELFSFSYLSLKAWTNINFIYLHQRLVKVMLDSHLEALAGFQLKQRQQGY